MHVVQEGTVNGHSRVGVACMSLGLDYLESVEGLPIITPRGLWESLADK